MKKTAATEIRRALSIVLGSLVFSAAVGLFLSPVGIVGGGFSGIAIILSGISGLPPGLLFLFLNLPVIAAGLICFGAKFMLSTIFATLLSSAFTSAADAIVLAFGPISSDTLLCALFGGAALGAGVGLIFKSGASTGGADIIVKIVNRSRPQLSPGLLFLIGDGAVVALSAVFTRSFENALYSALAVALFSLSFDKILRIGKRSVGVLVVSKRCPLIEERLLSELKISPFVVRGEKGEEKSAAMLFTAPSDAFAKTRRLILDADPDALFSTVPSDDIQNAP